MSDNSDDTGGERVVFAMLVGVTFGAALGTTVLQDITQGMLLVSSLEPSLLSSSQRGQTESTRR